MSVEGVALQELLALARARGASDLHLGSGDRSALRIDGRLTVLDGPPLAAAALADFAAAVLPEPARQRLAEHGTADAACRTGEAAPYRLHAYRTAAGLRLALRLLPRRIPALAELGIPGHIAVFAARPNGLLLFTGPAGSGKTTAIAALIDAVNRSAERVIVTIEDPIEFEHPAVRSLVVQCAIGDDVTDYAEAVRGFVRADPDVIVIGEMRDRPTIEAALSAAETGHLVLSTLHTNDAAQTIDRIVDAVPANAREEARTQLAATLIAVVSLRLVPVLAAPGRRAACEILVATDATRAMIRDGRTHQLRNALATGRSSGMQTLEMHLSDLVVRGLVGAAAARAVANRPADVREVEGGRE